LPSLDPALMDDDASTSACVGGTPNGAWEPNEECDDGNILEDDGCTPGCLLSCEGLLDAETGTCYFIGSPEVELMNAFSRCDGFGGGAYPLSIRSDRERDLLIPWLEQTSLQVVLAGLYVEDNMLTWRATAPEHPGWSASCPGCYAWWADSEPQPVGPKRVAVMRKDDGWRWTVGSSQLSYGLICERPRPGRPENLCALPDCDPASTHDFVTRGTAYRVRNTTLGIVAAEEDCRAWGGHVVAISSDEERELLVRFGPPTRSWIGLFRQPGEEWRWVDGVSTKERPIPWSSANVEDNELAAVLAVGTSFDTRLVESHNPMAQLPYVCEKPL
jgi:cysteine-rich repeat protein